MGITDFIKHSSICNKNTDWSEALDALSYAPDGPDKQAALEEVRTAMNTCTCGVNQSIASFAKAWYLAGLRDAGINVTKTDHEHFDNKYSDALVKIN